MDRAVPALLAALIVLASVGTVVAFSPPGSADAGATTPVDGAVTNTTDVLLLETVDASTFSRADLVVTTAIDEQAATLESTFKRYQVETQYQAATTDAEREQVLENATIWVEEGTEDLLETEQTAREEYIAGDLSAREYLNTLGSLHRKAGHLLQVAETVSDLGPQTALQRRLDMQEAGLLTLRGPVRANLAGAIAAEQDSRRTFVAVSDQGVTLATINNGLYVRETVRVDNRDVTVGQMGFDAAEERFNTLYPWASENKQRISMGALGPDVYSVDLTHSHGSVNALLDSSTAEVYREVQTKTLADTPSDPALTTTANNTTVVVSRAYAGGPLKVTVTNETEGTPLQATVTVNETHVGTTDAEGSVWTVSPAGQFNVTASTDETTITVRANAATADSSEG